jgi:hypothetical protein
MKRGDTAPRLGHQLLQQFNSAFTADPAAPDRSRPFIIPGSPKAVGPSIVIIP